MYLLEGNIGVGKTTLLSLLPGYSPGLHVVPESVYSWNNSIFGQTLLTNYYRNPHRWAYTLETLTLIHRVQNHRKEQRKENPNRIIERSVYSGHYCYAKTGYNNGFLTEIEWDIYNKWADFLIQQNCLPPYAFIYLKAEPEVCFERIQRRDNPAERTITLEYLKQMDKAHDQFFIQKISMPKSLHHIPTLVLDCNPEFLNNTANMILHSSQVKNFLNNTQEVIKQQHPPIKQTNKKF